MDNTYRIVLEGYAASSDFRIHITDETLLIVAASPTTFQISYALVDLAECEVLDTVRLIAVKVDFSCIVVSHLLNLNALAHDCPHLEPYYARILSRVRSNTCCYSVWTRRTSTYAIHLQHKHLSPTFQQAAPTRSVPL